MKIVPEDTVSSLRSEIECLNRLANAQAEGTATIIMKLEREIAAKDARIAELEEVLADKRRLTRELDVAMNGEEGAAKQASLCDLIGPAKRLRSLATRWYLADGTYETLPEEEVIRRRKEAAKVIEAARKIQHWHDDDRIGGMIVSADAVRELWDALRRLDGKDWR